MALADGPRQQPGAASTTQVVSPPVAMSVAVSPPSGTLYQAFPVRESGKQVRSFGGSASAPSVRQKSDSSVLPFPMAPEELSPQQ